MADGGGSGKVGPDADGGGGGKVGPDADGGGGGNVDDDEVPGHGRVTSASPTTPRRGSSRQTTNRAGDVRFARSKRALSSMRAPSAAALGGVRDRSGALPTAT